MSASGIEAGVGQPPQILIHILCANAVILTAQSVNSFINAFVHIIVMISFNLDPLPVSCRSSRSI